MAQTVEMLMPPPAGYVRGNESTPAEIKYGIGWHNQIGLKYLKAGFNAHAFSHFTRVEQLQTQLDSILVEFPI